MYKYFFLIFSLSILGVASVKDAVAGCTRPEYIDKRFVGIIGNNYQFERIDLKQVAVILNDPNCNHLKYELQKDPIDYCTTKIQYILVLKNGTKLPITSGISNLIAAHSAYTNHLKNCPAFTDVE